MCILETERLIIRDWTSEDWQSVVPLASDGRVLRYIAQTEQWSDEQVQRFISQAMKLRDSRGWILWPVIHRADDRLIGTCGFWHSFEPETEISWRLHPDYWGRGLMTEAALAMLSYGWRTFDFDRVISVASVDNIASIRIMQKIGMFFEKSFVHMDTKVVQYAAVSPTRRRECNCHGRVSMNPESDIVIEKASVEDAVEILELQNLAYVSEAEILDDFTIPPLCQTLEEVLVEFDSRVFLKVELDGRIIGSVRCHLKDGTCHIGKLIVSPDCRNRGIGTRLLQAAEGQFPEAGRYELFTSRSSQKNLRLYEKGGYRPFRTRKISEKVTLVFLEKIGPEG